MVKISVAILVAKTLANKQVLAIRAPVIVTTRHPYRLTNDEEIGPKRNIFNHYSDIVVFVEIIAVDAFA